MSTRKRPRFTAASGQPGHAAAADAGAPGAAQASPPGTAARPDGSASTAVPQGPRDPHPSGSFLHDLRTVWSEPGFRRLLSVRMISQAGDGVFTAGLGTYVFFNATTFPSPAKGAAAFAVLYAPYSLIGPFAGVFIDRWRRRQILVYSALIRSVFVAGTAVLMAAGNLGPPLYVAVLLVLGLDRFFLSSLSAALPHVVAEDKLVTGNAVAPTMGGIMAALGGIVGLGVNAATGNTEAGAAITLLVAGLSYLTASLVAARTMHRDLLGPQRRPGTPAPAPLLSDLKVVAIGLMEGARYIGRRRGPAAALGATGGNRLIYGILLLLAILLYRNYFYRGASASVAEAHFGLLVTLSAIGYFCAALLTPPVTRRLAKPAYITLLLVASAIVTAVFGQMFLQIVFLVIGFCVNLASQSIAICATTILQEELADDYRGRAFAFYDMMFNITYVAGALITAPLMPLDGKSASLMAFVPVGYAVVAAGYWLASRGSGGTAAGLGAAPGRNAG